MVRYRRSQTLGASYFFTVNLHDRSQRYLTDHINHLRHAISTVHKQHPFEIIAIVVLPEHLHTIFKLPEGDHHYPKRWQAIKSRFTRALVKEGAPLRKNLKGEYNLWQRRYWEHQIRDEEGMQRHIDYIHYNPIKHGHVSQVKNWPHSSFHRYVQKEVLNENWGGQVFIDDDINYGE
ncbi:transposase [Pseudomonadota bacterium]